LAVPGGAVSFCPLVGGRIGACSWFTAGEGWGGRILINTTSYRRANGLTDILKSIDPSSI
jgi:hypothetical protein